MELQVQAELGEEVDEELGRLQTYFLDQQRPQKFSPYESDNVILTRELQFEEVCATLEESGVTRPKELTEWEFYSRLAYYQKRYNKERHGTA